MRPTPVGPFRVEQAGNGWTVIDANDIGWIATGSKENAQRSANELSEKYPSRDQDQDTGQTDTNIPETRIEFRQEDIAEGAEQETRASGPHSAIATFVKTKLQDKKKFSMLELQGEAQKAHGSPLSEGKYSVKDIYDAMELGINQYLLDAQIRIGPNVTKEEAAKSVQKIRTNIIENIPTQTKRTQEQDEFQQFSTPPNIAYIAAWAANITPGTLSWTSLEFAGLAVFAK